MNLDAFESLPLDPIKYYLFLSNHKSLRSQLYNESVKMLRIQLFFMVVLCQRK